MATQGAIIWKSPYASRTEEYVMGKDQNFAAYQVTKKFVPSPARVRCQTTQEQTNKQ